MPRTVKPASNAACAAKKRSWRTRLLLTVLSNAANAEARSIVAADEEGGVVEDVAGEIMRGETKGPKGTYQVQKLLKKEEITLPKDRQAEAGCYSMVGTMAGLSYCIVAV